MGSISPRLPPLLNRRVLGRPRIFPLSTRSSEDARDEEGMAEESPRCKENNTSLACLEYWRRGQAMLRSHSGYSKAGEPVSGYEIPSGRGQIIVDLLCQCCRLSVFLLRRIRKTMFETCSAYVQILI